jgi:outer membrane protein
MEMPRKSRFLSFIAVLLATTAVAQEGLLDIFQRAVVNDPAIREAEANYLATLETRPQARSSLLPSLSLGGSNSGSYSESTAGVGFAGFQIGSSSETESDNYGLDISISQSVFNMSRIRTLRQADKVVAQAEVDFESAKQDLLLRVAEAYFGVLAAEDILDAEVATREAIARQLEQAQRRFEVGLIAITDVQQSQAAYDNAIATEIAAQRVLATRQEGVREIVGEYVTELNSPMEELPLLPPDPASPDQWVNAAMEQNLAVLSSRLGADIAQDDIGILRAARLPTLDFSAGYNDSTFDQLARTFDENGDLSLTNRRFGDNQGYNWSFNFRMPLFTGGLNGSRVQQAVYRHRAALEGVERVARETERATRDAYLGVISEISRVRALQQAVESNETALRATEAGFEVGTQTTVDVLAAQDSLRRAQSNYAISRYDYILNVLRLSQAAGSLSEADVVQVDGWLQ